MRSPCVTYGSFGRLMVPDALRRRQAPIRLYRTVWRPMVSVTSRSIYCYNSRDPSVIGQLGYFKQDRFSRSLRFREGQPIYMKAFEVRKCENFW